MGFSSVVGCLPAADDLPFGWSMFWSLKPPIATQGGLLGDSVGPHVDGGDAGCHVIVGTHVHASPGGTAVVEAVIGERRFTRGIAQFRRGGVTEEDGSMGIHGRFVVVPGFSDKQELLFALHVQRHAWVVPGVDKAVAIKDDVGGQAVKPHEVVDHLGLGTVEVAFRLNDVRAVGGFSTSLHPRRPRLEGPVGANGLHRHVLVVALDGDEVGVAAQQVDHTGRVGTAIDDVTQQNDPVFGAELEPMEQGPQGGEMAVNVPHCIETVPVVQTGL